MGLAIAFVELQTSGKRAVLAHATRDPAAGASSDPVSTGSSSGVKQGFQPDSCPRQMGRWRLELRKWRISGLPRCRRLSPASMSSAVTRGESPARPRGVSGIRRSRNDFGALLDADGRATTAEVVQLLSGRYVPIPAGSNVGALGELSLFGAGLPAVAWGRPQALQIGRALRGSISPERGAAVIEQSIEINRSVGEVFAYLDQLDRHTEWQESLVSARLETEGPTRVGTRVVERRRVPGGERDIPYEITEHGPPRRSSFRGTAGPVRPVGAVTVDPVGESSSRVSLEFDLEGHGIGKLLAIFARRGLQKRCRGATRSSKNDSRVAPRSHVRADGHPPLNR